MNNQNQSNRILLSSRFKKIALAFTFAAVLSLSLLVQFSLSFAKSQLPFFKDAELSILGPISNTAAGDELVYSVESNDEVKQEDVRVVGLANGNVLVGWDIDKDDGDLLARIFDASGTPLTTTNISLYDTGGNANDVALTATSDNGFYALWFKGDRIMARKFDSSGVAAGPSRTIISDTVDATNAQEPDMVELPNGNFMLTWVAPIAFNSGNVAARLYDSNLNPLSPIVVFSENLLAGSPLPKPAVAPLKDGGSVVTWSNNSDRNNEKPGTIYFQRFDPTGVKVGSNVTVSQKTGKHTHPQIDLLANGNFVIVYDSNHADSNGFDITARIFDSTGNAVTDAFLVNTKNDNNWQLRPDVASLKDNSFVVTWESFGGEEGEAGGGSSTVLAVQLDQNGKALSDEFVVNQSVVGLQEYAFVSTINGTTPVVVWEGRELVDTDMDGFEQGHTDVFMRILNRTPVTQTTYTSSSPAQAASEHIQLVGDESVVSVTVQISANFETGIDQLQAVVTSPVTSSYDAASGMLTLSGSTSFADYEKAVKAVKFESSSENIDDLKTVTWTVYGPSGVLSTVDTYIKIEPSSSTIYLPFVIR